MIANQRIGTVTVIFPWVRKLHALRKVKPRLLTVGQVGKDTGVEQEIIIIGFAAWNGIGRVRC